MLKILKDRTDGNLGISNVSSFTPNIQSWIKWWGKHWNIFTRPLYLRVTTLSRSRREKTEFFTEKLSFRTFVSSNALFTRARVLRYSFNFDKVICLSDSRCQLAERARGPVHVLARELITRENNIIERIIGQESETPLSAGPTGPLITSLFHVNVLHDINYLGGWPIGRIQRELLFQPPLLPSPSSIFSPFFPFNFTPRSFLPRAFNPFTTDRGRSFDRDFHRTGENIFRPYILLRAKSNTCPH